MKILKKNNCEYGIIGDDTCIPNIKVGDIVNLYYNNEIFTKVMVKDRRGSYAMGFGVSFEDNWQNMRVKRLVSNTNITEEILKMLGGSEFSIEEIEHVEMTIGEIERKLGHKVKIVK